MKTQREWIAQLARSVKIDNRKLFRRETVDPDSGEVLEFISADLIDYLHAASREIPPWGHYPATVEAAVLAQHGSAAAADAPKEKPRA